MPRIIAQKMKRSKSEWNNIKKELAERVTIGSSAAI